MDSAALRKIVMDLVWPEGEDPLDPSAPENGPQARVKATIANEAVVKWIEEFGGRYLLRRKTDELCGKVLASIRHRRGTTEERNRNLALLDDIMSDARHISEILYAIAEEAKRKGETTNKTAPEPGIPKGE